eukprot:TRINITY_DN5810_c0_g1_i2.p1 TRINITY_DN5810_c0_g1~~TRINITY_DN5810_c0_g1_i2.p1  ORF type:complete len:433 (-),score=162.84 TRINITY_DN5810_c0_g1_i2:36-1334(-)
MTQPKSTRAVSSKLVSGPPTCIPPLVLPPFGVTTTNDYNFDVMMKLGGTITNLDDSTKSYPPSVPESHGWVQESGGRSRMKEGKGSVGGGDSLKKKEREKFKSGKAKGDGERESDIDEGDGKRIKNKIKNKGKEKIRSKGEVEGTEEGGYGGDGDGGGGGSGGSEEVVDNFVGYNHHDCLPGEKNHGFDKDAAVGVKNNTVESREMVLEQEEVKGEGEFLCPPLGDTIDENKDNIINKDNNDDNSVPLSVLNFRPRLLSMADFGIPEPSRRLSSRILRTPQPSYVRTTATTTTTTTTTTSTTTLTSTTSITDSLDSTGSTEPHETSRLCTSGSMTEGTSGTNISPKRQQYPTTPKEKQSECLIEIPTKSSVTTSSTSTSKTILSSSPHTPTSLSSLSTSPMLTTPSPRTTTPQQPETPKKKKKKKKKKSTLR